MNRYRDKKTGEERLWFDDGEIESIIEDELVKANLCPTLNSPVVNVERFVESYLDTQFDPYAALPDDVIGQTIFRIGERPIVMINADLTGAALDDDNSPLGLQGRWRATVAHEGSHVLLHTCLFIVNPSQKSLFKVEHEQDPMHVYRCMKREVSFVRAASDWKEIQANKGMAALLMPKSIFFDACRLEFERLGVERIDRHTIMADELASRMAKMFQVSRQAASIRLDTLSILSHQGQKKIF